MHQIFPESLVYANYEAKNEVILFLNYEQTDTLETKLATILELFLPLQFRTLSGKLFYFIWRTVWG